MLNKCSTKNKYIVVSLKEDININGFAIINTEFYSSNVKDIVVISLFSSKFKSHISFFNRFMEVMNIQSK